MFHVDKYTADLWPNMSRGHGALVLNHDYCNASTPGPDASFKLLAGRAPGYSHEPPVSQG